MRLIAILLSIALIDVSFGQTADREIVRGYADDLLQAQNELLALWKGSDELERNAIGSILENLSRTQDHLQWLGDLLDSGATRARIRDRCGYYHQSHSAYLTRTTPHLQTLRTAANVAAARDAMKLYRGVESVLVSVCAKYGYQPG